MFITFSVTNADFLTVDAIVVEVFDGVAPTIASKPRNDNIHESYRDKQC